MPSSEFLVLDLVSLSRQQVIHTLIDSQEIIKDTYIHPDFNWLFWQVVNQILDYKIMTIKAKASRLTQYPSKNLGNAQSDEKGHQTAQ